MRFCGVSADFLYTYTTDKSTMAIGECTYIIYVHYSPGSKFLRGITSIKISEFLCHHFHIPQIGLRLTQPYEACERPLGMVQPLGSREERIRWVGSSAGSRATSPQRRSWRSRTTQVTCLDFDSGDIHITQSTRDITNLTI